MRNAWMLIASSALVCGCFSTPQIRPPMRLASTPEMRASAGSARLIVLRPDNAGGRLTSYVLIDGPSMDALGVSTSDSVYAVDLPAGPHQLCLAIESNPFLSIEPGTIAGGSLVSVKLAAGKVYFVRVDVSASSTQLTPLRPGTADWADATTQLPLRRALAIDNSLASAPIARSQLAKGFQQCVQNRAGLSAEESAALNATEADGL